MDVLSVDARPDPAGTDHITPVDGFSYLAVTKSWRLRAHARRVPLDASAGGYDPGMTKRVTVSLPDDVAAYLEGEGNVSAAVADAVRARMDRAAATAAMLRAVGIEVAEPGAGRGRRSLPRLTEQQRADNARRRGMLRDGTWPVDDPAPAA
jgi:hypothetical protein